MVKAFNERGVDAALGYFAPEVEIYDPDLPDAPLRGREGARRLITQIAGAFEQFKVKDAEFFPVGDRVVGLFHHVASGEGTLGEMQIEMRDAHTMTFRDGQIVYWRLYLDRDEALADAGLGPDGEPLGQAD
jgi:hypothetical protein